MHPRTAASNVVSLQRHVRIIATISSSHSNTVAIPSSRGVASLQCEHNRVVIGALSPIASHQNVGAVLAQKTLVEELYPNPCAIAPPWRTCFVSNLHFATLIRLCIPLAFLYTVNNLMIRTRHGLPIAPKIVTARSSSLTSTCPPPLHRIATHLSFRTIDVVRVS